MSDVGPREEDGDYAREFFDTYERAVASLAVDQDGAPVLMCSHHPETPATAEDLFETPLCSGCAIGLDRRDDEQQEWDS